MLVPTKVSFSDYLSKLETNSSNIELHCCPITFSFINKISVHLTSFSPDDKVDDRACIPIKCLFTLYSIFLR